jgi:hypothetical protein
MSNKYHLKIGLFAPETVNFFASMNSGVSFVLFTFTDGVDQVVFTMGGRVGRPMQGLGTPT